MTKPIDMILYCPNCGMQHIDRPNHWSDRFDAPMGDEAPEDLAELNRAVAAYEAEWTNPPHKSHLCHGCGCIWRPADVATNGVAKLKTSGKDDTWPAVHNEEVRAARGVAPSHEPSFTEADEDMLVQAAQFLREQSLISIAWKVDDLRRRIAAHVAGVALPDGGQR